jgi:cobalt/nickel transport system permease protein
MAFTSEYPLVSNSPFARWDPRWRLGAFLIAVIAISLIKSVSAAAMVLMFVAVIVWLAKVPFTWLRSRLTLWLIVMSPFLLTLPFTVDRGESLAKWGFLHLTDEGIRVAILLLLKTLSLATFILTFLTTAPFHLHLEAAQKLGMPRLFVHLTLLTYRYIFLFIEELNRIRIALRVRGFRNAMSRHSYQTAGRVAASLLVRGADRGEHVAQAMRCRGFSGTFRSRTVFCTRINDIVMFLMVVLPLLGLAIGERFR